MHMNIYIYICIVATTKHWEFEFVSSWWLVCLDMPVGIYKAGTLKNHQTQYGTWSTPEMGMNLILSLNTSGRCQ